MDKLAKALSVYDVTWEEPHLPVRIVAEESDEPTGMVEGNYLNCARMNVDITSAGLHATCLSGSSASFSPESDQWNLSVVRAGLLDWEISWDMDDLLSLVLTNGWRCSGFVPIHAGAVAKDRFCAILCAPSGAGKTTLVTALIRRGWRTLGDDKLLLRLNLSQGSELLALVHSFNLDPIVRKWFPELANIKAFPADSPLDQKRRVRIDDIWPGRTIRSSSPTHLLEIGVRDNLGSVKVTSIKESDILSVLLHQTAIPKDLRTANQIVSILAPIAIYLKGFRVEMGRDAYDESRFPAQIEDIIK
jgi:hypothetical protein